MRILVLNGVNLDVPRTPRPGSSTAGSSLGELESQIYAVGDASSDSSVRVPADEQRGRVRQVLIHEALDWADGVIVNPARVDALQLRDPRRARAVRRLRSSRCTSRTSSEREEWRARLGDRRPRGAADHRQSTGRLPARRSNCCVATRVNEPRRAGPRASLEEPLLVYEPGERPLPHAGSRARTRRSSSERTSRALTARTSGMRRRPRDRRLRVRQREARPVPGRCRSSSPGRSGSGRPRSAEHYRVSTPAGSSVPAPRTRSRSCAGRATRGRARRGPSGRRRSSTSRSKPRTKVTSCRTGARARLALRAVPARGERRGCLPPHHGVGPERGQVTTELSDRRARRPARRCSSTRAASSTATAPTARGLSPPEASRTKPKRAYEVSVSTRLASGRRAEAVLPRRVGPGGDSAAWTGSPRQATARGTPGHGLGHGIGLRRPREDPRLAQVKVSEHPSECGNGQSTVGIYLSGLGDPDRGSRHSSRTPEPEVLTTFPKEQ